jgi:hypothetical protein
MSPAMARWPAWLTPASPIDAAYASISLARLAWADHTPQGGGGN